MMRDHQRDKELHRDRAPEIQEAGLRKSTVYNYGQCLESSVFWEF
jgi:hypothetical protein